MKLVPLTIETFQPFGNVIQVGQGGNSANQGRAKKSSHLTRFINLDRDRPSPEIPAIGNLCSFSVTKSQIPFELKLLERHKYSTQMFLPFTCMGIYLVIVALNDPLTDTPDMSTLTCFKCDLQEKKRGFNYNPGVWHHPMVVFEYDIDFIMYVFERGSECVVDTEDTEEFYLKSPILITLD